MASNLRLGADMTKIKFKTGRFIIEKGSIIDTLPQEPH